MTRPVLFLSASHQQSAYWARQLGFAPNEWRHIGRPHHAHGWGRGTTLYIVGTWWEVDGLDDFLALFASHGIEGILAEEMVTA